MRHDIVVVKVACTILERESIPAMKLLTSLMPDFLRMWQTATIVMTAEVFSIHHGKES